MCLYICHWNKWSKFLAHAQWLNVGSSFQNQNKAVIKFEIVFLIRHFYSYFFYKLRTVINGNNNIWWLDFNRFKEEFPEIRTMRSPLFWYIYSAKYRVPFSDRLVWAKLFVTGNQSFVRIRCGSKNFQWRNSYLFFAWLIQKITVYE